MTPKDEVTTNLEELKKQYDQFKEKYNLPDFTDLNKQFDVEEIDIETEFLLRRIRRIIAERIVRKILAARIMKNSLFVTN